MLFNSHLFLFAFLPLAYCGFFFLKKAPMRGAPLLWLLGVSLVFYAWWNPKYIFLIAGSILVNYTLARFLERRRNRSILTVGIGLNIGALVWFKYALFIASVAQISPIMNHRLDQIVLPLAISFFTFQQIAYLVDIHRGATSEPSLVRYATFVSFFPQLIAGPIVQFREMAPQFDKKNLGRFSHEQLAVGLSLFFFGLFEKVVLADGIAIYATPVFEAANAGLAISFFEAWGGLLAYTFQIYFDFSGYSTMAVGLGWMFGIKLPINFNSPYQARSVIDFWRRWHMTLSRFLKHYLYFPLGGNRKGKLRQSINLMITMTIGGAWHGAGWNFIYWGFLHGLFLVINVWWRQWRQKNGAPRPVSKVESLTGWVLTFALIVLARAFFRTSSTPAAWSLVKGAFGSNGADLDTRLLPFLGWLEPVVTFTGSHAGHFNLYGGVWILVLGAYCLLAPSPLELFVQYEPYIATDPKFLQNARTRFRWQPNLRWALITAALGLTAITHMARVSEFIYYQF